MKWLFQTNRITTLEEFKKSLENRIKIYYILVILGLFTFAIGILSKTTSLSD